MGRHQHFSGGKFGRRCFARKHGEQQGVCRGYSRSGRTERHWCRFTTRRGSGIGRFAATTENGISTTRERGIPLDTAEVYWLLPSLLLFRLLGSPNITNYLCSNVN